MIVDVVPLEILNYVELNNQSQYFGQFDIQLDCRPIVITVRRLRLFRGKKNYFISWPSYKIEGSEGPGSYLTFIDFKKEIKDKIELSLRDKLKNYIHPDTITVQKPLF